MSGIKSFLFFILVIILINLSNLCLLGSIFLYNLPDYSDFIIELSEKKWGDILSLNLGEEGADQIENVDFSKLKEYCAVSSQMKNQSNIDESTLLSNISKLDFNFSLENAPEKEVIIFIDSLRDDISNINSTNEVAVYVPDEFCSMFLSSNITTVSELKEEIKSETKNKVEKLSSYSRLFFIFFLIFLILASAVDYFDEKNLGKTIRNISKYWIFTALPLGCFCILILVFGPKLVLMLSAIPILNQVTNFYYLIHLILEPIAIIYIVISILGIFGWVSGFGIPLRKR